MNTWRGVEWPASQDHRQPQAWDQRGAPQGDAAGANTRTGQPWAPDPNPLYMMQQHAATGFHGMPDRAGAGSSSGACPPDVRAMTDEQLYALVMNMKNPQPPAVSVPAGAQMRQPPCGAEDAKNAIKTAKASIGSKTSSKADQGNESGSEDDDLGSESFAGKSKRVLANRQSAHRSRLRKLQYIQDLENNVTRIQAEISHIQPQLNFLRGKYTDLNGENLKLRERVGSLLNEARYKEALNSSLRQDMKQLLGDGAANNPGDQSHMGSHAMYAGQIPQPSTLGFNPQML